MDHLLFVVNCLSLRLLLNRDGWHLVLNFFSEQLIDNSFRLRGILSPELHLVLGNVKLFLHISVYVLFQSSGWTLSFIAQISEWTRVSTTMVIWQRLKFKRLCNIVSYPLIDHTLNHILNAHEIEVAKAHRFWYRFIHTSGVGLCSSHIRPNLILRSIEINV